MNIFLIVLNILFTIFGVGVLAYISMVTPVGPWIELVVALLVLLFSRMVCRKNSGNEGGRMIGLASAAAGIGGITATVFGFTIPTLYFIDKSLFLSWLSDPIYFAELMGGSVLVAGLAAWGLVWLFGDTLLADERMPYPIGQMVARVMGAQKSLRQAVELVGGMVAAACYHVGYFVLGCARNVSLFSGATWGYFRIPGLSLSVDQLSIFLAIGFIAGDVLLVPLIVGITSKIFLVEPLQKLAFSSLSPTNYLFAFGGGLVLQEALFGFLKLPKTFRTAAQGMKNTVSTRSFGGILSLAKSRVIVGLLSAILVTIYFLYFGFSLLAIFYIVLFSVICGYQLLLIGGKAGLAPFGRFATFVMLPGIAFFAFDGVQATIVSLFVSLMGAMAVDIMFGLKMAQSSGLSRKEVTRAQLIGLFTTAAVVGTVFWFLFNQFQLGSPELLAQRAQSRAALISAFSFDYVVLALGALFGLILHYLRVNTALVFTGLLFNVDQSLMLICGGLLTLLVKDKSRWEPFWSGVFAAGSLLIMILRFLA